ncbi:aspartate--tRNA(Asn) ligase [Candidatus Roizmanbacteria bacterium]|nr:aspartate--tRNA(Asn) ligase [Candidatus Roizmanbacteria bacterium]
MKKIYNEDTIDKIGEEVELFGWVQNIRDHKKIVFVDLRDRTGIVQVVGDEKFRKLSPEDVISVKGVVKERPKNLVNPKLMSKDDLNVTLPTLLDYRALTLRHPKVRAIFEVQEVVIDSFRKTMKEFGFVEFQAPLIVPSKTEGGAEVFAVKYFHYDVYLGQSPQLYKQIMLGAFEKVFTVTRAFRAEPSVTTRHLTEYISLDAEMAFIDSWQEILEAVEALIRKIMETVEESCKEQLRMYNAKVPKVSKKIPQLKLKEAQELIYKRTKRDIRGEPDLSPTDEEEICKWVFEEKSSEFVFITHYPLEKRPFYTHPDPKDPNHTLSFDLLCRGLEWVTGGQRINDYNHLVENIKKWGDAPYDFELYLQAFRFGMPPEGGFCLGAERITEKILGLANVREASLFPRDMERVDVGRAKNNLELRVKNYELN